MEDGIDDDTFCGCQFGRESPKVQAAPEHSHLLDALLHVAQHTCLRQTDTRNHLDPPPVSLQLQLFMYRILRLLLRLQLLLRPILGPLTLNLRRGLLFRFLSTTDT